ncbi:MAG: hypothetical protein M3125_08805, partial [Gemmatimonadota bacterium]|nr:hypothetical protein [Gemmatimonadota bacterium]
MPNGRPAILGLGLALAGCGPAIQPSPSGEPSVVVRADTLLPPMDSVAFDSVWRIPVPVDSLPLASGRLVRVALSSGVPAIELGASGTWLLTDEAGNVLLRA